jgi:transposase InsO family protein
MDFIYGLSRSEGKIAIIIIVDRLIKYSYFLVLSHPFTATDIAQLFLDNIYKLHGLPFSIMSDRDTIFTSKFWKGLMEKVGVKLNYSTIYHPQSDGETERVNQCIENHLICMVFNQPRKWSKWVPLAEY